MPRVLAESAGLPATNVVTALAAAHAAGKSAAGVDVDGESATGVIEDVLAAGIRDSAAVKLSALRLASEVAITVLRVDQIIMSKQAGGPKPRAPGAPDED